VGEGDQGGGDQAGLRDGDQPKVRISVVRNSVEAFVLSRVLKQAQLVYAENPDAAFELLRTGHADAFAQARPALLDDFSQLAGLRVLEGRCGANLVAITIPKGQAGQLAYISEFIEEANASGSVQRAIDRAGLRGVHVPRR